MRSESGGVKANKRRFEFLLDCRYILEVLESGVKTVFACRKVYGSFWGMSQLIYLHAVLKKKLRVLPGFFLADNVIEKTLQILPQWYWYRD